PVIGVSAIFPGYMLLELVKRISPPADTDFGLLDVFYTLTTPERILVAVGIVALGPLTEEILFRGALFRPLAIDKSPLVVVPLTALLFAAAHLDPHAVPHLFLMGLVLG